MLLTNMTPAVETFNSIDMFPRRCDWAITGVDVTTQVTAGRFETEQDGFTQPSASQASTLAGPPGSSGRGQLPILQLQDKLHYHLLCVVGELLAPLCSSSLPPAQVSKTPMPAPTRRIPSTLCTLPYHSASR